MPKGGKRPGAGRKKGSRDPGTLEKERVFEQLRMRIIRNADSLFNAQASIAKGQQFLFRVDTVKSGKGCKHCGIKETHFDMKPCLEGQTHLAVRKVSERKKPVLVSDPFEIAAYIDRLENNEVPSEEEFLETRHYFITTKEPNNMAIIDMYNRAFGKPTENVKLTGTLNIANVLDQLEEE